MACLLAGAGELTPPVNARLGLAVALLFLLVACGQVDDERIRFGLPTAPVTLDPRFATDAQSDRIAQLLHRPLIVFDGAAKPQPELADWQQLSLTHYRFTIRDGATFNSGRQVSAHDVAATYRSILDPATASPHQQSLNHIVSVTALDERQVDFVLSRPDSLFPGRLVVGIMSARDLSSTSARDTWRESSGSFERVSHTSDGRVLLRRRHDHALLEFVTVKDVSVRALKLVAGELDIVQGNIAPELYRWLSAHPQLRVESRPGTTFSYLGFNLKQGPTASRNVRLAIAHAIDRKGIIQHLFGGAASAAAAIFPPQHWAGAFDLAAPEYDPQRARQLLAEAGFDDGELELTYKTSSDYFRLRIAQVLQQQLKAVGVKMNIHSLDWGTFYGDVRHGRFQLYGLSWVGLKMPDIFRYAFHSTSRPPAGANRGAYSSAEADELIEASEQVHLETEKKQLYQALQQRLLYDLPYIPLWFEDQFVIRRADIVGYHLAADGRFEALAQTHRSKAVGSH